ncbi:MAG: hypothetical protein LBV29_06715 [Azoarcus sp.]|jgi:hypothetical protein|nr:hypothetical protein [Azoarcus sp.]
MEIMPQEKDNVWSRQQDFTDYRWVNIWKNPPDLTFEAKHRRVAAIAANSPCVGWNGIAGY